MTFQKNGKKERGGVGVGGGGGGGGGGEKGGDAVTEFDVGERPVKGMAVP